MVPDFFFAIPLVNFDRRFGRNGGQGVANVAQFAQAVRPGFAAARETHEHGTRGGGIPLVGGAEAENLLLRKQFGSIDESAQAGI